MFVRYTCNRLGSTVGLVDEYFCIFLRSFNNSRNYAKTYLSLWLRGIHPRCYTCDHTKLIAEIDIEVTKLSLFFTHTDR